MQNTYLISVYTTSTRTRVTEHAIVEKNGIEVTHGKNYWYNRPWYRYRYQTALKEALAPLSKKLTQEQQAVINKIVEEVNHHEEAIKQVVAYLEFENV